MKGMIVGGLAAGAVALAPSGCAGPDILESPSYKHGYMPTTSMTVPGRVATSWSGTWTYRGHSYFADLQLFNTDPISATIHIPGWCDATWSEVQRSSETSRLVRAHVISGNCHDNQWNVTVLLPNSITGTDTINPSTMFEFNTAV
jgi:hypothetical protein